MQQFVIRLDDETAARLVEYARNEAGEPPEQAIANIIAVAMSEDFELDEAGDIWQPSQLDDSEWLEQPISIRQMAKEYGVAEGTIRSHLSRNPDVKAAHTVKVDERTYFVKRRVAVDAGWGTQVNGTA